jgi:predicted RND superfamily exporter protein
MLKNRIIIFVGLLVIGFSVFSLARVKIDSGGKKASIEKPLLKKADSIEPSEAGFSKESVEAKVAEKIRLPLSATEQLQAQMDIVAEELRHINIEVELNNSTTSMARRQEIIGKMNLYAKMMGEYARLEAAEIKREVQ